MMAMKRARVDLSVGTQWTTEYTVYLSTFESIMIIIIRFVPINKRLTDDFSRNCIY